MSMSRQSVRYQMNWQIEV